jgi:hypothetical protein
MPSPALQSTAKYDDIIAHPPAGNKKRADMRVVSMYYSEKPGVRHHFEL